MSVLRPAWPPSACVSTRPACVSTRLACARMQAKGITYCIANITQPGCIVIQHVDALLHSEQSVNNKQTPLCYAA